MSSRAIDGAAAKRQRLQLEEEEAVELAALQMAARPKVPLPLLCVVMWFRGTLVWLQLCNAQGVALFSFVLPPRMFRPFAGAPVYDMSLTHAEHLSTVGCGLKGRLVRLLSLGVGGHFEPQRNRRACCKMMQSIVRRVAAGLAAAVRDKAAKEAEELCASGQCAAAVVPLQRAIDLGDLPSLALKAWLLIEGREGVAVDRKRGFELAEEGARLGCHHCQGVIAYCYLSGCGCEKDEDRSLELACESAGRGSRYGQHTLGSLHYDGYAGLVQDYVVAVAFDRLAAAQGLDEAQNDLGYMYKTGEGVATDHAEALRWFQLSAAQGHPQAFYNIADCHEYGCGVAVDVAEAVHWYRRAQAAGDTDAAYKLQELYRLPAVQGFDWAQCELGLLHSYGQGVAQDHAEALRLYQLAAAQGHAEALYDVAVCHQRGYSVAADVAEAVHWYRRAQAAGHPSAAGKLQELGFGASGIAPSTATPMRQSTIKQFFAAV